VRSVVELAARPEFSLFAVSCHDDHRDWSAPELRTSHGLVLVRRGRFRRLAGGTSTYVDATVGYVSLPGGEERFAHPDGGDVCTSVAVAPDLWRAAIGRDVRPVGLGFYVDARLALAHRQVLSAARTGDVDYALAEHLLALLRVALGQVEPSTEKPSPTGLPTRARGLASRGRLPDHEIVGLARRAIVEAHPASAGLLPLGRLLGVSPYRLSRAFSRELGVSLTRFRNRVRVGKALDRLEAGEPDLAQLAADLGFADQAHLTRTMRAHLGHTPAALRRLLAPNAP
jgi:AraC-like DNA-binding protein